MCQYLDSRVNVSRYLPLSLPQDLYEGEGEGEFYRKTGIRVSRRVGSRERRGSEKVSRMGSRIRRCGVQITFTLKISRSVKKI